MYPQRCRNCGTPRKADLQVCVRCETPFDATDDAGVDPIEAALPRPAAPSTVQTHGTVMLALVGGFVVLAVLLGFSVRDVGPFRAQMISSTGSEGRHEIVVEVSNAGRRAGRGNCLVTYAAGRDARPAKSFTSERIPGGETIRQTVTLVNEADASPTTVTCR